MSKISEYLNKIKSSIYGKDVRQAIYDAISQCYDDVSKPDLNTSAFYNAVQKAIADGTFAGMEIADGQITTEKIADAAITKEKIESSIFSELVVSSTFDEITGDLSFNVNETLQSKYPYGFKNAPVNTDYIRNATTGELESTDLLRSATDWFILHEGVYLMDAQNINDGINSNYGKNMGSFFEADKQTGAFMVSHDTKASSAGGTIILTAHSDRIYSYVAPTQKFTDRILKKNTAQLIQTIEIKISDIVDKNVSTAEGKLNIDITDYVPIDDLSKLTKFKVSDGFGKNYLDQYGNRIDVKTWNYINPTNAWINKAGMWLYRKDNRNYLYINGFSGNKGATELMKQHFVEQDVTVTIG